MNLEDRILIMRVALGSIGGVVSAILALFNIQVSLFVAVALYLVSILISKVIGASTRYDLYLRGTLVFFISWFLILLVIYNI